MAHKKKKIDAPKTTAQALGSLVKSARDIMRKDKGLNGDLDRLPLLTWIMFLKFLDDLERQREEEAKLAGKKFRAAIESPYRWRDWAANSQGITGDELLKFINQDELKLPSGKRGPGLFAYLRSLTSSNGDGRRDVIATVFRGVDNRMKSGYLLRDVINKISGIHFTSTEELHTLGALYETILREMRDAAGDSGEFYTPRPVVRFMVELINPRLGEVVLDPASGTGGFLVEAFNHLSDQVKTVADRRRLQSGSILGCEPKPLPYLLCQMNLLLHGLDAPQIDSGNALRFKLSEIGEKDRVDVILTNPPFGGEEEKGIQGNFPDDKRTSETALLFLQLIMRRLKRSGIGRAAVVVPESVMSDAGTAGRLRKQLIEETNLSMVVRLPKGVFEPYSDIQTNILFFDTSKPTSDTWFYQLEVSGPRRKARDPKYTLTNPLSFEELRPILDWCGNKRVSDHAWLVSREDYLRRDYTLDFRNPSRKERNTDTLSSLSDAALQAVSAASKKLQQLSTKGEEVEKLAASTWPSCPLSEVLVRSRIEASVSPNSTYKQITVKLYGKGVIERGMLKGNEIKTRPQFVARSGNLIMSRIDARSGAFGIIPDELDGALVTQDFPMFRIDEQKIRSGYLALLLKSDEFAEICKRASRGTTNRKRLNEALFLSESVPLPPIDVQDALLEFSTAAGEASRFTRDTIEAAEEIERRVSNLTLAY